MGLNIPGSSASAKDEVAAPAQCPALLFLLLLLPLLLLLRLLGHSFPPPLPLPQDWTPTVASGSAELGTATHRDLLLSPLGHRQAVGTDDASNCKAEREAETFREGAGRTNWT